MNSRIFSSVALVSLMVSGLFLNGCSNSTPTVALPTVPTSVPTRTLTAATATTPVATRPEPAEARLLYVNPDNPRYFTDGTMVNGKYRAVLLTGSHTWCNFVDCGASSTPPKFNYDAYLNFLVANHHNFFRLWRAENARGGEQDANFWFDPMPYQRPGPGTAEDGKPKFDLAQFDQAYFDRMRSHIIAAGDRGIYVSIMLFDGWSVESKHPPHQPWIGHPYNQANNINGVNGDANGDGSGEELQRYETPPTATQEVVLPLEEAYVRKVIDSVNDLDNVLYEIANEATGGNAETAWEYRMIDYVKSYEQSKPKQHPVGMTVQHPGGSNADLLASHADWVSPNGDISNLPVVDGSKVVIFDTDHLCGICGDRQFVWKSFMSGGNTLFMDPYDGQAPGRGAPDGYDPNNTNDVSLRLNMGYARDYAERMNLAAMAPHGELSSTGFCLANPAASGAEYLVFLPGGATVAGLLSKFGIDRKIDIPLPQDDAVQVDLSASPVRLMVEWFNPGDGTIIDGGTVQGGASLSFTAPFTGDAVLYIHDGGISQTAPQTI